MFEALKRILIDGPSRDAEMAVGGDGRERLEFGSRPPLIYAIGDVHGSLDLLLAIEEKISADAASTEGDKWIVMLGDYIDRGPDSAGVIDHLLDFAPRGFRRFCLMGNHEHSMLKYLRDPYPGHEWLGFGGFSTLASYGLREETIAQSRRPADLMRLLSGHIPSEHIQFLEELTVLISVPGVTFVHAGVRPGVRLQDQVEHDLLWIRDNYQSDYAEFDGVIVHGHTPRTAPLLTEHRIAVDTGACFSGVLSAVRISDSDAPRIISVGRN